VSFLNVFSGTANGPGNFDSPETHTKFMAENRRMNHVAIFRVMTAHETSFRVFGAEKRRVGCVESTSHEPSIRAETPLGEKGKSRAIARRAPLQHTAHPTWLSQPWRP
jgi:hypothetical protein